MAAFNVGIIFQWHMPSVCSILSPLPWFVDYIGCRPCSAMVENLNVLCSSTCAVCKYNTAQKESIHDLSPSLYDTVMFFLYVFVFMLMLINTYFYLVQVNVY